MKREQIINSFKKSTQTTNENENITGYGVGTVSWGTCATRGLNQVLGKPNLTLALHRSSQEQTSKQVQVVSVNYLQNTIQIDNGVCKSTHRYKIYVTFCRTRTFLRKFNLCKQNIIVWNCISFMLNHSLPSHNTCLTRSRQRKIGKDLWGHKIAFTRQIISNTALEQNKTFSA